MKKVIWSIVFIVIGIAILSCLIISFINDVIELTNNGQVLEVIIGISIAAVLWVLYNVAKRNAIQ